MECRLMAVLDLSGPYETAPTVLPFPRRDGSYPSEGVKLAISMEIWLT